MCKLGGSPGTSLDSQSMLAISSPTPALPSLSRIPLPPLDPGGLSSPLHLSSMFLSPQPIMAQDIVTVSLNRVRTAKALSYFPHFQFCYGLW